jgi:D-sedoheptulose 7-phosphate isomerase|tara:strand:+ start:1315 stop:1815 length:501 start_codon:yes stop_codon:yes gene_type:complete
MLLSDVQKAISEIDPKEVDKLKSLLDNHDEIIMIGNGGSNAICSHIAQDYTKFLSKRAYAFSDASRLTCYINDFGMELAYKQFIEDFATDDTLVILISSSGNSENIVNCGSYCVDRNLPFVIITGFDKMNALRSKFSMHAELDMYVDSSSYGVVECVHQMFLHTPV